MTKVMIYWLSYPLIEGELIVMMDLLELLSWDFNHINCTFSFCFKYLLVFRFDPSLSVHHKDDIWFGPRYLRATLLM